MSLSSYNEIVTNLYLGGAGFVYETAASNFDLIVNCCPEISCSYENTNKTIEYIKILDRKEENERLIQLLYQTRVLEKIEAAIQANKKVMVHCAMGQQRSPTIIVCYLMRYKGFTKDEAIELVRRQRPEVFIGGTTFVKTLEYMEREEQKNR